MSDGITNAIITKADAETHDRARLTVSVSLDYGGSGQVFGGYELLGSDGSDFVATYISGLLEAVGASSLSELRGKTCRVKIENGLAVAVGHIVRDKWFEPREVIRRAKG